MGLLTQTTRTMRGALPGMAFPNGNGRMFLGWGNTYFGGGMMPFRLPDEADVRRYVGDGSGTALISAAVNWMKRELVAVRPIMRVYDSADEQHEGVPRTIRRHPALDLTARPNPYYDGIVMRQASALSWLVDGNVYKWKIRSAAGRVVQKWYLPHFAVTPIGFQNFIDHYRVSIGRDIFEVAPEDMIHMRFGLDPQNPRRGLSPVGAVLRDVYTDEEARRFTASLLRNLGMPGAVIIPGTNVEVDKDDAEAIEKRFADKFTGDGRGRAMVMSANADVKILSWSPQDLQLGDLRDVPEERVAAVVGIPAAILGFGTGLQQVKVGATMETLVALGWQGALIPYLLQDAETDTMQLLPEFISGADLDHSEYGYDLSSIGALSGMELQRATIESTLVRARIKTVDEARGRIGLPAVGGEDGGFQASPGVGNGMTDQQNGQQGGEESDQQPNAIDGGELLGIEPGTTGTTPETLDMRELAPLSKPSKRTPRFPSSASSWVYFIGSDYERPIKIGVSTDPESRLRDLQTSSPEMLQILGKIPGNQAIEAELHRRFKDDRISGEWYRSSPELRALIANAGRTDEATAIERRLGDAINHRQAEVASLLVLGRTNKEIASALSISERSVEREVSAVLAATGTESRVDFTRWMNAGEESLTD